MLYRFDPAGHEGPPNFFPVHTPLVPFLSIFLNALWIQFATIYPLYISISDSDIQASQFPLHGYQLPERDASHPPDEPYPNTVTYGKLYFVFSRLLPAIWKPLIQGFLTILTARTRLNASIIVNNSRKSIPKPSSKRSITIFITVLTTHCSPSL